MIGDFVSRAVLVGIRVGGLMTFAPFFANSALPKQSKAALTLLLTALILPVYAQAPVPAASGAGWMAMAFSEAAIGLVAGLATQFVFDGMELAGQIIGFQFGFSLVNIIDPNSQVEVTVLSTFHDFVALLIFMELGVHRLLLRAIAVSFRMVPAGSLAGAHLSAASLVRMSASMWVVGAEIAFPVLLATLLIDLTIGFVVKASPQFPAMFMGIAAKFLVGVAVLYGTVAFWPRELERYFFHALAALERALSLTQ